MYQVRYTKRRVRYRTRPIPTLREALAEERRIRAEGGRNVEVWHTGENPLVALKKSR